MTRILVVDDEEPLRRLIALMLSRAGYDVSTAENGVRALRLTEEHAFDLMITDLVMPEKEGLETIMVLRKSQPQLRIIAMSGGGQSTPDGYLHVAKRLGASATLEKPFTMDELLSTVRLALES